MGRAEPAPSEVLYRRGRTSTMCTLILTGKVVILAGRDGQLQKSNEYAHGLKRGVFASTTEGVYFRMSQQY